MRALALFILVSLCLGAGPALSSDAPTPLPPKGILSWVASRYGGARPDADRALVCLGDIGEALFAHNALIKPAHYTLTNYRGLPDIEAVLGAPLREAIASLAPRSQIVLTGGGYGFYGLALAQRGHLVTVFNTVDFYNKQIGRLLDPSQTSHFASAEYDAGTRTFSTIGFIPVAVFNRWVQATEMMTPSTVDPGPMKIAMPTAKEEVWKLRDGITPEVFLSHFRRWLIHQSIATQALTVANPPRFTYNVISAQSGLEDVTDHSIALMLDFMDAAFYTSHRLDLYNLAWKKLRPGGKFIVYADGIMDFVRLQNPSDLIFRDLDTSEGVAVLSMYLARKYPAYVQIHLEKFGGRQIANLVFTRPADAPDVDFGTGLRAGTTWVYQIRQKGDRLDSSQQMPLTEYTEVAVR